MKALGFIETIGLGAAIEAADTVVKSANVTLLGYELTKGGGMVMIKFEGDVGAVKAALEAGSAQAERVGKLASKHMIARPNDELEKIIYSKETVGFANPAGNNSENNINLSISSDGPEIQIVEELLGEVTESEPDIKTDESEEQKSETAELVEENISEEVPVIATTEEVASPEHVESEQQSIAEISDTEIGFNQTEAKESVTCNICNDPKCPRQKGDLRTTCIHYKK